MIPPLEGRLCCGLPEAYCRACFAVSTLRLLFTSKDKVPDLTSEPTSCFSTGLLTAHSTVIRLNQRAEAFDRIFAKPDEPRVKAYWKERKGEQATPSDPSREFFSGEIASLLDTAAPVGEVRIQRNYANGRLREEIALLIR